MRSHCVLEDLTRKLEQGQRHKWVFKEVIVKIRMMYD